MRKLSLVFLFLLSGCLDNGIYQGDNSYSKSHILRQHEDTCSKYGFVYGSTAFSKCVMNLDIQRTQQKVTNNSTNENRDYLLQQDGLREMKLRTELDNVKLQKERLEIEQERLRNEKQLYNQEQIRAQREKQSLELKRLQQEQATRNQQAQETARIRQQQEQVAREQQAQETARRQQQEQAARIEEEKREAYERGQRTWDPRPGQLQSSPNDNPYNN